MVVRHKGRMKVIGLLSSSLRSLFIFVQEKFVFLRFFFLSEEGPRVAFLELRVSQVASHPKQAVFASVDA